MNGVNYLPMVADLFNKPQKVNYW